MVPDVAFDRVALKISGKSSRMPARMMTSPTDSVQVTADGSVAPKTTVPSGGPVRKAMTKQL
jgi:hypothetical protein